MKRVLGEADASRLNARPAKVLKVDIKKHPRTLHHHLTHRYLPQPISYPILRDLQIVSEPEDARELLYEDSHCVPFAVRCATTCSLTAIADEEGTIRIFDSAYNNARADLFRVRMHRNAIFDLAWSADDKILASASGDQTIALLDVQTQSSLGLLSGHTCTIKQVIFDPRNPQILTSGGRDGLIAIWDVRAHRRPVASIAQAHGLTVQGTKLRKIQTPPVSITSLLYKRDGHLVSGSAATSALKTWDLRYLPQNHSFPMLPASIPIPSQRSAAEKVQVGCTKQERDNSRSFGVNSLSLSADGTTIFGVNRDSKVRAYAASHPSNLPIAVIRVPDLSVKTFYCKGALAGDDSGLMVIGNASGNPVILDTARAIKSYKPLAHKTEQEDTVINHDVKTSILCNDHAKIFTGGHKMECTGVSFSYDSSAFVTISDDCHARTWRRNDMEQLCQSTSKMDMSSRRELVSVDCGYLA